MAESEQVLIVEDDDLARSNLEHILNKEGYEVEAAGSGEQALALLEQREFDLVITDLRMKHVDGLKVLERSRTRYPNTEVIVITAYATVDSAVEAMRRGAYHYISKPYKIDLVRKLVWEALHKRRLQLENVSLKQTLAEMEREDRPGMVGSSQAMRQVTRLIEQVAPTESSILLIGETGTGKELAAGTIHALSRRHGRPFVAFNCGAFTEELLANELFGHEKEAYTGATAAKAGLIEAAHRGTVFLDEIGEMPLSMQVKLLRVIEEREVLRVGANRPVPVDVRFIGATSRNLKEDAEEGRFRRDLYYRLNVVEIHLPPLSERGGDVMLLAHHFLGQKARQMGKTIRGIDPEAREILVQYSWPGNVRELENIVERAGVMAADEVIRACDLPEDLLDLSVITYRARNGRLPTLEEQEVRYIQHVLEQTGGNRSKAAEILDIDRSSLWRKLKRHGLD